MSDSGMELINNLSDAEILIMRGVKSLLGTMLASPQLYKSHSLGRTKPPLRRPSCNSKPLPSLLPFLQLPLSKLNPLPA
jgi:hypothetical protein